MKKNEVPTFKIKPKQGVTVKDPETFEALKKEGEAKPRNAYWLRRVQDGDCIVLEPKTATKRTAKKEAE
ncbi:hypothetical protein VSAK1_13781 [Vibrio mediterranei AK1]|uniref:DUF2635 domain-containing protein n=1 Tax=Vibrio mediterranei TaxID=689 RepID=UPI00015425A3|nr:DUF2635 domain-containing protein [Vibrio mediterranei]EDL52621.1 hypothetical protein VSAK1_13781 [Vibrio mediterranei AK1]